MVRTAMSQAVQGFCEDLSWKTSPEMGVTKDSAHAKPLVGQKFDLRVLRGFFSERGLFLAATDPPEDVLEWSALRYQENFNFGETFF
jgi:hypothetical protein